MRSLICAKAQIGSPSLTASQGRECLITTRLIIGITTKAISQGFKKKPPAIAALVAVNVDAVLEPWLLCLFE